MDDAAVTRVEREPIEVLYLRSARGVEGATETWRALEERLGSLRGRMFLGSYDYRADDYRACVARADDLDAEALGLEEATLPGGTYLRQVVVGDPPGVYAEVGPAFGRMAASTRPDGSRPSLEHYRRHYEIELLLPVLPE